MNIRYNQPVLHVRLHWKIIYLTLFNWILGFVFFFFKLSILLNLAHADGSEHGWILRQDQGRSLPKFGEWDVNNPASAEGFTVIFSKARDEKKSTNAGTNGQNSQRNNIPPRQPGDHLDNSIPVFYHLHYFHTFFQIQYMISMLSFLNCFLQKKRWCCF